MASTPQLNSFEEAQLSYGEDVISTASGGNEDRVSVALLAADAAVTGALNAAGYTMAQAKASSEAKQMHLWLFFYYLLANRATDDATMKYDRAVIWLRDIAAKKVGLSSDVDAITITESAGASYSQPEPLFTAERLSRYTS